MSNQVSIVMKRVNVVLKPCTRTLGKPFEGDEAKCPLYRKVDSFFTPNGWSQTNSNAYKTGISDKCSVKYTKAMVKELDGQKSDLLFTIMVDIEGSDNKCSINLLIDSFKPGDKIRSLDHEFEDEIVSEFNDFLSGI